MTADIDTVLNCWTSKVAFLATGDPKETIEVREGLETSLANSDPRLYRETVDRLAGLQFNKTFVVLVAGVVLVGVLVRALDLPGYGLGLSLATSGAIFMGLLSGLRLTALRRLGSFQIVAYRSIIFIAAFPVAASLVVFLVCLV